jgi:thioredoxin-like negative regulator of GroEL
MAAPARVPSSDPAGDSGESEPTTVHNPVGQLLEPLPDTYDPFARRTQAGWVWAFVIVATILAFGSWLLWPMLFDKRGAPVEVATQDPAVQFLARADSAFATHREQRFEDAITDYTKALAFHESDPHVLSSISRVFAVWAQEVLTRADLVAKESGTNQDLERRSQLLALNKLALEYGEQAKRYAENAARKNPGNEEAEIALSDALRLTGNLVSARSSLDRARKNESSASGETLRVAALLAIAEAQGDLSAGLPLASQAVAQDPELIRARLLLARCLIADGDVEGARYHLAAVSTKDRSHPGVLALERQLAQKASPRDATLKPDAGPSKESSDGTPAGSARNDKDKDRDKDKDEGNFDNLSHEAYIARGQKLLESGQVTSAKRMFEQALFIRPSSAEAHAGLGFVALEKGRTKLAVEHFQEAKKDGDAEALIGLGEAYRRMNRPREALRAYTSYVADHPRGPQIGIAKAQVERLTEEASAGKK